MAYIHVRIDDKLKMSASKVFKSLGLDISSAVKLFLQQVVITKSIPFRLYAKDNPVIKKMALKRRKL
ncbi:type II toxin-antitoxin system RelB/DinJ family antitoxin [Candidatus Peregrinibacteria bacterium]|nr:type II toxin-antitoxin system RelB/DinJ family antitoxin [Candidatus Peregrinibacteria bacterium]